MIINRMMSLYVEPVTNVSLYPYVHCVTLCWSVDVHFFPRV